MSTDFGEVNDNQIIQIGCLKDINFKIWAKNRMVDMLRVNELKEMYESDNYKVVPGIIHTFEKDGKHIIYDGSHRYFAAKDFPGMHVIFTTLKNPTKEMVDEAFRLVNKSVPVPECYFMDDDEKKKLCVKVVEYVKTRWPDFCKASSRPVRPNFNQDKLTDEIFNGIRNNPYTSYDKIIKLIEKLNKETKKIVLTNGIAHWKKCVIKDFWILFLSPEQLQDKLMSVR
jgi:hypothetical protein